MARYQDHGLTEERVIQAITSNKGDLIRSHCDLGVSVGALHNYIRKVPSIRRAVKEMERMKQEDGYEALSDEQFREQITAITSAYQLDGLNVIHELATTDHDGNASMADVRLKAAVQLRGPANVERGSGMDILADLNRIYQETAHRVKTLRVSATIHLGLEAQTVEPIAIPSSPSAS